MKRIGKLLALGLLMATILSGCVVVPLGGWYGGGYYHRSPYHHYGYYHHDR